MGGTNYFSHPFEDFSNHPMVSQDVKDKMNSDFRYLENARDVFVHFLEDDVHLNSPHSRTKIAVYLQEMAHKYTQLSDSHTHDDDWHDYYELSFQKFLRKLPKTREELDEALRKLIEWDCANEAGYRGVNMQGVPQSPPPSTEDIVDAVAKKVAGLLLSAQDNSADKTGTEEADAEDRPAKRVKVDGGDGTATFSFEVTVKVTKKDEDAAK